MAFKTAYEMSKKKTILILLKDGREYETEAVNISLKGRFVKFKVHCDGSESAELFVPFENLSLIKTIGGR